MINELKNIYMLSSDHMINKVKRYVQIEIYSHYLSVLNNIIYRQ